MDRRRLWGLVALAFGVGAVIAGLLFYEGGSLLGAPGATAVLVRVANEGHDANVTVTTRMVEGGRTSTWSWLIPDGGEQTARHVDPGGQLTVNVRVAWSAPARDSRGDASYLADPAACPGRQVLLSILANTANGVSIATSAPTRCV